jgi:hypothetical protein
MLDRQVRNLIITSAIFLTTMVIFGITGDGLSALASYAALVVILTTNVFYVFARRRLMR